MPKKSTNRVHPETEKLLRRTGYFRSLEKYGHSRGPDFPDLKIGDNHRERYPSVGGFAAIPPLRSGLPDGAKTFPVGQSHKQGPILWTAADDPAHAGGKKT